MKYILLLCVIIALNSNASTPVSDSAFENQSTILKKHRPDKDFSVIKRKHGKKSKEEEN